MYSWWCWTCLWGWSKTAGSPDSGDPGTSQRAFAARCWDFRFLGHSHESRPQSCGIWKQSLPPSRPTTWYEGSRAQSLSAMSLGEWLDWSRSESLNCTWDKPNRCCTAGQMPVHTRATCWQMSRESRRPWHQHRIWLPALESADWACPETPRCRGKT